MTDAEIKEIENLSGDALNIAVYERVLKFDGRLKCGGQGCGAKLPPWKFGGPCPSCGWRMENHPLAMTKYHEEPEAAWHLVETMAKRGCHFDLKSMGPLMDPAAKWDARFVDFGRNVVGQGEGKFPEAVARAALEVVTAGGGKAP